MSAWRNVQRCDGDLATLAFQIKRGFQMTKEMYTPQIKIVEFSEEDIFCNFTGSIVVDGNTTTDEQC